MSAMAFAVFFSFVGMKEILDDDFRKENLEDSPTLSTHLKTKTAVYFLVMLAGNFAYDFYQLGGIFLSIWWMLGQAFEQIFGLIFISLVLEIVRYFFHKRKEKKAGRTLLRDPFWFQIMEGAFAIWLLFSLVKIFSLFFFLP